MKENFSRIKNGAVTYWKERSKSQKITLATSVVTIVVLIVFITWLTSRTNLVPLYQNLSPQEVGQIKEELDVNGTKYEIENSGSTVLVEEDEAEALLVDLASEGLPNSGNIDYSFFSENASFGITDNEFDMMKLDATQTELANLMKRIEGIEDAKVMINMSKEPLFVNDGVEEASASIVIHTQPGYQFEGNQIESLYHLVSRAIPNLPEDNIVIMNQYFEYFDQQSNVAMQNENDFTSQQSIKQEIERDLTRRLQQMIGAMVGPEKSIVSVTVDVDFTKENRQEELIEPVDVENMEGVPISIETLHETYSGNQPTDGVPGTGEEDIPGYQAGGNDEDGDYELVKETINNEFNHIHKDIVESPYKIRDIGIQVAVDRTIDRDDGEVQLLNAQEENEVEQAIGSILDSMISTSIDKEYGEIETEDKASIVFQEFSEQPISDQQSVGSIPIWFYLVGGILLVGIIILIVLLVRKRREDDYETEMLIDEFIEDTEVELPEMKVAESESVVRRKQLEKMAKDKPEEFAKLLRSWISEE